MKKQLLVYGISLVMISTMSACGGGAGPQATGSADSGAAADSAADSGAAATDGEVFEIRYGGTLPDSHHITMGANKFKELVEERSGGRILVSVYPNNQIGAPRDLIEGTNMNTVQMCDNSMAALSGFTDDVLPLTVPFLFPSREVAFAFIEGPTGDEIVEKIASDTGIRIAGWNENGYRQLTNSKHTIRTPEDLAGLKIRVMESPIYIKIFESLGASPTPMSVPEMFTGMQQGTVDGQDNPPAVVASNKFYEVQSYMSDLNHAFDFIVYLVSDTFYMSLPDDLRAVFDDCMDEAMAWTKALALEHEAQALEVIQEEMEYTYLTVEERAAFAALCEPVYDWFRETYPDQAGVLDRYVEEISKISA